MAFSPANLKNRFISIGREETAKGTQTADFIDVLANVGAIVQVNSNFVERNVISDDFGTFGGVHTSKVWDSSIQFENKGGGSSSPIPEITNVLRACALGYEAAEVWAITGASGTFTLGETVSSDDGTPATGRVIAQTATFLYLDTITNVVGAAATITGGTSAETATMTALGITSAVYLPVSDYSTMDTVSLRDVRDNDQRTGLFTMGTGVFTFATEGIPTFDTTLTSLYATPIAPVASSGTVSTVTPDPWIGATFELNGVPCGDYSVSAFSLDLQNTVAQVKSACSTDGIKAVIITESKPMLSVTITKAALATINPFTLLEDNTLIDVFTGHGSGAGERIRIGIPNGQITQLQEGEEDGVENYTVSIAATKSGGSAASKFHAIYY